MTSELTQRRSISSNSPLSHRKVQHHTPRHYPVPSDDVQHPAPILNQNISSISEIFTYTGDHTKFVLVMVGLPARGKSFIARKIRSYLSWLGIDVQWFNIGQYRRECAKDTVGVQSSDFFNPKNKVTKKRRELYALIALAELEKYLVFAHGQVAILDGTNTTEYRRKMIRSFFVRKNRPAPNMKIKLVFIESICNDESIIEKNILNVKLRSPDYIDVLPDKAVRDFKERIKHYENMYTKLTEEDGSYIKLIDAGKQVIGHDVNGYLPSRILYFLMHLNLTKVAHFFTRHGESLYNTQNRIGGDSPLTESGVQYSKTMADFMSLQPEFTNGSMKVWCSTLKRCTQTASPFNELESHDNSDNDKGIKVYCWRALCEIEAGVCDSMSYKQIAQELPSEYMERRQNKLTYRYPQGESYKDVIKRLEPVIFELERAIKPILVIAHQAVLRCLYGYFMDEALEDIPYLKIDLHTVYKLTPTDYSTEVDKFTFGCGKSKHNSKQFNIGNLNLKPDNAFQASLSAYLPTSMRVAPILRAHTVDEEAKNDDEIKTQFFNIGSVVNYKMEVNGHGTEYSNGFKPLVKRKSKDLSSLNDMNNQKNIKNQKSDENQVKLAMGYLTKNQSV